MTNRIYFVDVTNRDGVQTSRLGLAKLQKTLINLMLDDMGITQSEFGFPTTMHELNYLNANLELVELNVITKTKLSGWMRAIASDVETSFSNVPKLQYCNLSQSTSEQMIYGKYMGKKTPDDILKLTCEAVECAVDKGAKIIGVNAEDASRSDLDFLIKFIESNCKAKDVKLAVLFDKKCARKYDVVPNFSAFDVDDKFIVGFGLDYCGLYRNLNYIGYFD